MKTLKDIRYFGFGIFRLRMGNGYPWLLQSLAWDFECLRCWWIGRKPQPSGTFRGELFWRDPLNLEPYKSGYPAERPYAIGVR
jgi:hypothetical protein